MINTQNFFILTNPLYWVILILSFPYFWLISLIQILGGFVKDYLLLKFKMDDLSTSQLESCLRYSSYTTKWNKKWTNKKINEKAVKILKSLRM